MEWFDFLGIYLILQSGGFVCEVFFYAAATFFFTKVHILGLFRGGATAGGYCGVGRVLQGAGRHLPRQVPPLLLIKGRTHQWIFFTRAAGPHLNY